MTEALWGYIKDASQEASDRLAPEGGWEDALIIAHWPEPRRKEGWEDKAIEDFKLVQEMIRAIRNVRAEYKVELNRKIACQIFAREKLDVVASQTQTFISLAGIDPNNISFSNEAEAPSEDRITLVIPPVEISLPLAGLVDMEAERERLEKELAEAEVQIARLEKLLASPFARKSP